jgi:hypothetical protein
MTVIENLEIRSTHSRRQIIDADPSHFEYPSVAEFMNAEVTPKSELDLSDDIVIKGLRQKLGIVPAVKELQGLKEARVSDTQAPGWAQFRVFAGGSLVAPLSAEEKADLLSNHGKVGR